MKLVRALMAGALAAAGSFWFFGCEADSTEDFELTLEPLAVSLRPGQSQAFKASGGFDYRWNLRNERIGVLSSRTGDQVIYTATATNAEAQVLTVRSIIHGATGSVSTNTTSTNQVVGIAAAASATIDQSGGATPTPPSTFSVSPSSVILTPASPAVTFFVNEGLSVRWTIQNGAIGGPSSATGPSFTYTGTSFPTSGVSQIVEASYTPAGGATVTKTMSVTQRAN